MTTTPNGQADVIGGNSLRIDRLPGSATIARRWEPTISQASAVSFRALLAFTFVLLVAPQLLFPALRPLRLAMICAVIAIGSYILGRASRGGPLSVRSPELGAGAALAVWAIVTVPFSFWPGGSIAFLQDQYLKVLAIFWLIPNVVDTPARLRRVMSALTLLSLPASMIGLTSYLSGAFLANSLIDRIAGYDSPLTNNPNDLALLLALMLPVTLALVPHARGSFRRVFLWATAGVQTIAIVVTFSRTGFVALGALGTLHALRLARRRRFDLIFLALVLVACAIPVLPTGYVARIATIGNIDSDVTGSSEARWNDMVTAAQLIATHPLVGAGVDQGVLALNDARGDTWRTVHNAYLEVGIDLGLPGIGVFAFLVARAIRTTGWALAWMGRRPGAAPAELHTLAGGIRLSLIVFAVGALFSPVAYHFYLYYFAGLAVAVRQIIYRADAAAHLALSPSTITPRRSAT